MTRRVGWGIVLALAAIAAPLTASAAPGQADAAAPANPDYGALGTGFAASLVIALLAVGLGKGLSGISLGAELPKLEKDWSFDDSFATNAGLAVVLFTGLFASADVLGAVLGDAGKDAVALATIGAGLSAGVIALGPVLLTILATIHGNRHHVYSVGLASVAVLTGNGGLVFTMHEVLTEGDQLADTAVTAVALVVGVFLALYGVCASYRTLKMGVEGTVGIWSRPPASQASLSALP